MYTQYDEMTQDMIDEIRLAMFHTYCSTAKGYLTKTHEVMTDMLTILPVNENVRTEILKYYESLKPRSMSFVK